MRIIALLALRNEALYLERCLTHLASQGIEALVIDNDSTDGSLDIAQSFLGRGVLRVERLPYPGYYDWQGILRRKEQLATELDADWFIHHDADEIRQSPVPGQTLAEAIAVADAAGYDAIDFREFVFLPTRSDVDARGRDYAAALPYAYYFQPHPEHRVNAWKARGQSVDLVSSGGHRAEFAGRRLSPERLILRHYPFLSWSHLIDKYRHGRRYSDYEVQELGWHGKRACFDEGEAWLPNIEDLIRPDTEGWQTDRVWTSHPFLGGEQP